MTFREKIQRTLHLLKLVTLRTLGGVAILLVFVVSAFTAMRIAIHGREVSVPNLAGLSDADAAEAVDKLGLHLSVENRFYAPTVAANHVLSQSPVAGATVRRGWQIRVTESLGTQQVPVPDVTGQEQHAAELMLKRLQLEVGAAAHLPGPGPTGTILAQSPPPNTAGMDGPRVAVLVADEEDAPTEIGYVMPSLVGLSVATANARLVSAGLRLTQPNAPQPAIEAAGEATSDPAIPPTIFRTPMFSASSVITSQSPQPGHRVTRADNIRVTVAY